MFVCSGLHDMLSGIGTLLRRPLMSPHLSLCTTSCTYLLTCHLYQFPLTFFFTRSPTHFYFSTFLHLIDEVAVFSAAGVLRMGISNDPVQKVYELYMFVRFILIYFIDFVLCINS